VKKALVALLLVSLCLPAFAAVKTKEIKDLKTALKTKLPVVVKIGSDSCYPCRMMKPILKELKKEQAGKIVFLDLDIYENRELAKKYRVTLIPTVLFFDKHGEKKAQTEGFMNKADLLKMVKELELNK